MKIQILVPSQNQKSFSVDVGKDDTVSSFRSTIMALLEIPKDAAFSLIALGKIVSVFHGKMRSTPCSNRIL